MAVRKTPEEMALARRLKVARSLVRLKHSLAADEELNGLLADITDDHNLELATGGLKEIGPGTLDEVIAGIADTDDVNRGVTKDERRKRNGVLPDGD